MSTPEKKAERAPTIRLNAADVRDGTGFSPFAEFGEYTILTEIGQGGMGIVYGAKHRTLNRRVALKMMRSGQFATSDETTRFRREAEAAAKLSHPNIVPIYEIGKHSGFTFFSMQYVEGETLSAFNAAAKVRDAAWTRACTRLMVKVARAVQHAHEHLVLHRDIKPGNILIDEEGEPHVTDFGLAKLLEDEAQHTLTETVLGTPEYMSPEQAWGRSRDITTATDIFSLGAVFYHLLTGTYAFKGRTPLETIDQVRNRTPIPPRKINPQVPRDLEVICLKCLEKEPGHRFSSAAALADELDRWLAGRPIQSRRSTPPERLIKWVRRNPKLAGALGAAVLITVLSSIAVNWQWRQVERQRQETHSLSTRFAHQRAHQRAEELFDRGNPSLALAVLAELVRTKPANRVAVSRLVNALRHRSFLVPASSHFGRDVKAVTAAPGDRLLVTVTNSQGYVVQLCDHRWKAMVEFPHGKERVLAAAPSPDGKFIVTGTESGLQLWNAENGQLLHELKTGDPIHQLAFPSAAPNAGPAVRRPPSVEPMAVPAVRLPPDSPGFTDNTCAAVGLEAIYLVSVTNGTIVERIAFENESIMRAGFTPEGAIIVAMESGALTFTRRGPGAIPIVVSNAHKEIIRSLELSRDYTRVVTAATDGMARVWEVQTGKEALPINPGAALRYAEFSPDGTRIVTATAIGTAQLWNARTGEQVGSAMVHTQNAAVNRARFSADGQWIVTACDDGTTALWSGLDGRQIGQATPALSPIVAAEFLGTSRLMTSIADNGEAQILTRLGGEAALSEFMIPSLLRADDFRSVDLPEDDLAAFQASHTDRITFADVSADGSLVATASADRTARIWNRRTRRPVCEPLVHQNTVNSVHFSADATLLATSTIDRKLRVWDIASGLPVTDWITCEQTVAAVRFSTDSAHLVTAAGEVWSITISTGPAPEWLPQLAEGVAGRPYGDQPKPGDVPRSILFRLKQQLAANPDATWMANWARGLLHELPTEE